MNAAIAAGQSNPVDILMNSTGLLILNDFDDIAGNLLESIHPRDESLPSFQDKVEFRDKIFARILSLPHMFFALYYSAWFLGLYQYSHPMAGMETLYFWNPFSLYFYPPIVIVLYLYCYVDYFKDTRPDYIFKEPVKQKVKIEDEDDDEDNEDS